MNLYQIRPTVEQEDWDNILALVTAEDLAGALKEYSDNGGEVWSVKAVMQCQNYPEEICTIFK